MYRVPTSRIRNPRRPSLLPPPAHRLPAYLILHTRIYTSRVVVNVSLGDYLSPSPRTIGNMFEFKIPLANLGSPIGRDWIPFVRRSRPRAGNLSIYQSINQSINYPTLWVPYLQEHAGGRACVRAFLGCLSVACALCG